MAEIRASVEDIQYLVDRVSEMDDAIRNLRERWHHIEGQKNVSEFRRGMQRGYAVALAALVGATVPQIEAEFREAMKK
jgi:hypothetical protein